MNKKYLDLNLSKEPLRNDYILYYNRHVELTVEFIAVGIFGRNVQLKKLNSFNVFEGLQKEIKIFLK